MKKINFQALSGVWRHLTPRQPCDWVQLNPINSQVTLMWWEMYHGRWTCFKYKGQIIHFTFTFTVPAIPDATTTQSISHDTSLVRSGSPDYWLGSGECTDLLSREWNTCVLELSFRKVIGVIWLLLLILQNKLLYNYLISQQLHRHIFFTFMVMLNSVSCFHLCLSSNKVVLWLAFNCLYWG